MVARKKRDPLSKPPWRETRKRWRRLHPEEEKQYGKKYYWLHRDECQRKAREYYRQLKVEVLTHYGNGKLACVVCGEADIACLSIDHIEGGGLQHRRSLGIGSGSRFYSWLKQNEYPKGYQTLCMNCQYKKKARRKEL